MNIVPNFLRSIRITLASLSLFLCLTHAGFAQPRWVVEEGSSIEIIGTSTLHDWQSSSTTVLGEGIMEHTAQQLQKIHRFKFSIPVTSFVSGKSTLDDKMYEALNAKEHAAISFQLESMEFKSDSLDVTGILTISGVSKTINDRVKYQWKGENQITFQGSKVLDMTVWGIVPPVMFLGTIQTDKWITINYQLICRNK